MSLQQVDPDQGIDQDIIRLLSHRYGDGLVYLRDSAERALLDRAVRLGLVTREGYLTPAGRAILARHYDV